MLSVANFNYMHAKQEYELKKIEFINIQNDYDAASDAVTDYKDNHEKLTLKDSPVEYRYYLKLKAEEAKLERDKDRLEEDVELLEGDMKAFEDLKKDENKKATNLRLK